MRIILTAAALLLYLAPIAARADEKADIASVKACLAAETETPSACIGRISTLCQAKPEGQSTEGSVACAEREQAAWDAILNERYKQELAASQASDEDLKGAEGDWQPVAASLKTAQRAWIAYRDAECTRRYNFYQSGTYRLDAYAACELNLTAERAINIATSQE